MNKNLIIVVGVIVALLLGIFLFLSGNSSKKNKSNTANSGMNNENSNLNENVYPLGEASNIWDESISPFSGNDRKDYAELLEDLKTGKINFTWEVWALRRKCPENSTPVQCDESIISFIDKNYSSPDKEKIKDLFTSYFKYEAEARTMEFPKNISFEERYEILKKRRKEIVGNEKAGLLFGLEESQVEFYQASKNFIDSSKKMNPDERVKKYEELRKKVYGSYLDNVNKREDSYSHYQTEMDLRERELAGLSDEERTKKLNALQIKYFGKDGADRIAKAMQEDQAEQKKFKDYEAAEREFLSSNNGISEKDKEAKLKEMRVKYLGAEEAEIYSRRRKYEEENK